VLEVAAAGDSPSSANAMTRRPPSKKIRPANAALADRVKLEGAVIALPLQQMRTGKVMRRRRTRWWNLLCKHIVILRMPGQLQRPCVIAVAEEGESAFRWIRGGRRDCTGGKRCVFAFAEGGER